MQHEPLRVELLATVAHELRNPIAAIQSAVRVLERTDQSNSTLAQARALIDRQVLRIARLSDDLLSAGFMATGALDLHKERVDVRCVVISAVESCRPQIDGKRLTVITNLPPQAIEMEVDPIRLIQVLTNLLDNSAKYNDAEGLIGINVDATPDEITVRISDDGVGISPELLPHVFELFTQGSDARARNGMGIGLSLVKRIVESHGGSVEAVSAGSRCGSTFTVRLPRSP